MKRTRLRWIVWLAVGGAIAAIFLSRTDTPPLDPWMQSADKPAVIAHRGGWGLWPENTIYAFQGATEMGVDVLDFDVRATADGVLVVLHDERVDRTTNGEGSVQDLTWAELQELDAGYRWTVDNDQTYPYRGKGISIPTLQAVLEQFEGWSMGIELKQDEPPILVPTCTALRNAGQTPHVLVSSFSGDLIKAFREICPEVATSVTAGEATIFWALEQVFLSGLYRPPCNSFQVPETMGPLRVVDRGFVDAAHDQGLYVHVWTVSKTEEMERLIGLGVDGILTPYPDRALGLSQRGRK